MRLSKEREQQIRKRLLAQPGEEEFSPAYTYKVVFEDVEELLNEIEELRADLNAIENGL